MPTDRNIARTRGLQLAVPTDTELEAGPCTPTYEFPVTLPHPRQMPGRQGDSSLSNGLTLTPSPRVTGKRTREEPEWAPAEVEVLQNVLDRPPRDSLFAPGSMPPPHVLDDLTSTVVGQFGGVSLGTDDEAEPSAANTPDCSMDGYDASTEPTPCPSERSSRYPSPQPQSWPHSWDETRRMLTSLALADTRLGQEREDRKLTRQERLAARPGVRRVDSMDFLDDTGPDAQPSEKLGRVLRLSTKLQNSARETPALTRAASLGSPAMGPQMPTMSSTSPAARQPPSSFPRPFGLTPVSRPAPLRRNSSARSDRSLSQRRPSLLAIGRNFTASDLEAEAEESMRQSTSEPISHATSTLNAPELKTPTDSTFSSALGLELEPNASSTGSDDTSPRRRASAPDMQSPRLTRSHSHSAVTRKELRYDTRGSSHDYGGRRNIGLGLPPAPVHDSLGAAFDPKAEQPNDEWDSDTERSFEDAVSVKRRARRPHLAMTAMAGAAPPLPKLIIEEGEIAPALGSPFEERSMDIK